MTSKQNITLSVIITAAGSSNRMGSKTKKEYLPLNKGTILSESAKAFLKNLNCSLLVITTPLNKENQTLEALKNDCAIGAFNVNNMEIIQGIVAGAQAENTSLILQVSLKNSKMMAIK